MEGDLDAHDYDPLELAAEALRRRRKVRGGTKRKTARGQGGTLPYELTRLLGDANLAYVEKRYADAVGACKGIITKQPSLPDAYALMGLVYGEQGDHALSTDAYRLACATSPSDAPLWRSVGIAARAATQLPPPIDGRLFVPWVPRAPVTSSCMPCMQCACVRACVRVSMPARARVCVRVFVYAHMQE